MASFLSKTGGDQNPEEYSAEFEYTKSMVRNNKKPSDAGKFLNKN
jgi:hypothetical protein